MKILKFSGIFLIIWYINSCASVQSPSGGPKDTIPPSLISTHPLNNSVNFDAKKIILNFDENIQVNKLKKQLIITPKLKGDYEYITNKDYLEIEFLEPLEEKTTYTLYFRKSIEDITEKNPAESAIYTFSTGKYMDSLYIQGYVYHLLSGHAAKEVNMALYQANDTLDIFTGPPSYFFRTDKKGYYKISNIKPGQYKLFSFKDGNDNLKNDVDTEAAGFHSGIINLQTSIDSLDLNIVQVNTKPFSIISARPNNKYFVIKTKKYIKEYELINLSNKDTIYSNLLDGNKELRIYNDFKTDSTQLHVILYDTINTKIEDTLWIQFKETRKKPESFTVKTKISNNQSIDIDHTFTITFNKPIKQYNADSIYFTYDTIPLLFVNNSNADFTWNTNKTELSIKTVIDTLSIKNNYTSIIKDLSNTDTTIIVANKLRSINKQSLTIVYNKNSFISIDQDTTGTFSRTFKFIKHEDYGIISGKITNIEGKNYQIQLINSKQEVIRQFSNTVHYIFKDIKPATYQIRILLDSNNNGNWDLGNLSKGIQPEPVLFYPENITLRANWEIQKIDIRLP